MIAPLEPSARRSPSRPLMASGLFAAIVGGDVVTKRWAESRLVRGEPRWLLDGWVGLDLTSNGGVAFGLLDGQRGIWVLLVIALVGLGWLVRDVARQSTSSLGPLAVVSIAAGAAGNMLDRLADGRVTDFVAVGRWPRFNIADSSLTIGLGLVLVQAIMTKGQDTEDD